MMCWHNYDVLTYDVLARDMLTHDVLAYQHASNGSIQKITDKVVGQTEADTTDAAGYVFDLVFDSQAQAFILQAGATGAQIEAQDEALALVVEVIGLGDVGHRGQQDEDEGQGDQGGARPDSSVDGVLVHV